MKTQKKQDFEDSISDLAREATSAAYKKSIDAGNNVVIRRGNQLVEVNKHGLVRIIKELPPVMYVKKRY